MVNIRAERSFLPKWRRLYDLCRCSSRFLLLLLSSGIEVQDKIYKKTFLMNRAFHLWEPSSRFVFNITRSIPVHFIRCRISNTFLVISCIPEMKIKKKDQHYFLVYKIQFHWYYNEKWKIIKRIIRGEWEGEKIWLYIMIWRAIH